MRYTQDVVKFFIVLLGGWVGGGGYARDSVLIYVQWLLTPVDVRIMRFARAYGRPYVQR